MSLQGKTAVVTGAGGGIGWATVEKLAKADCRVICVVRRNSDQLTKKLLQLPCHGKNHLVYLADVTDSNSLNLVRDQITHCDILVNCTGKTQTINHSNLDLLTDEIFDRMMVDNLRAIFASIRTFLPLLQKSKDSIIVNIGSTASQGTGGSNLAYAAAKAGIDCLTRKLSPVIAPVRILTVSPGGLDTDFVKRKSDFSKHIAEITPLGRIGTVDDVADAVLSCIVGIKFATGQTIIVDGGQNT